MPFRFIHHQHHCKHNLHHHPPNHYRSGIQITLSSPLRSNANQSLGQYWVQFDKNGEETCWTEVIILKLCLINFKKKTTYSQPNTNMWRWKEWCLAVFSWKNLLIKSYIGRVTPVSLVLFHLVKDQLFVLLCFCLRKP